jgi:hypothetical protein
MSIGLRTQKPNKKEALGQDWLGVSFLSRYKELYYRDHGPDQLASSQTDDERHPEEIGYRAKGGRGQR